ncbi:cysteine hydrolase family protein [Natrarchaeobius oligotrophus]|uniref:Cysteine hydrolase n=1 Tax=Natrarchaeobius chitinivorans TaxID=1679083 RepID=A0A3N6PLP1_NATCH|nr:isochorismatase family cysteine hydrolase [Natrarchaeobius chitinivorans]RQH02390.1 cysteine hydrolase [Natrarchaeobius chitinivorans]
MIADPALVLIDVQAQFCDPDHGYVPETEAGTIEERIESANELLERYRETGRRPIFVRVVHDDRATSPVWSDKYGDGPLPCAPGSDGAAFDSALDVREDDVVVTKHRYDAFYGTDLEVYLSSNDVSRLLVGGIATDVCVESTVRSAYDRDYRITVLSDCTASADPIAHERSLERIDAKFGSVADSNEISLEER